MAQSWTESAPIDFSDFGQAAATNALAAQKHFAEQSKNFSDLLTDNIDKVNRNKNTLQAIELLTSLDVDNSKDLFKSGDIMSNIAQTIGTNNIDFNNENLTNALVLKQAAIKLNDESNLKDLLAKPENYPLLKEDPQKLQATTNSTLSISQISKIQKEAKSVFGRRMLREAAEDPKNYGRTAYDIEREILTKYKDYVDFDSVLNASTDVEKWKDTAKTQYSKDVINTGLQQSTLASSDAKDANGNPIQFSKARDEEVLRQAVIAGYTPEQVAALKTNLHDNLMNKITRDDNKRAKYYERDKEYRNAKDGTKEFLKARGKSRLTGAKFAIDAIVDNFDTSNNPAAELGIDAYIAQFLPGKDGEKFRYAYSSYGAPSGVSPAAFRDILEKIGVSPIDTDYKTLDDYRDALENNKSLAAFREDSAILPAVVSDLQINYKTQMDNHKLTFDEDLYDIANTGIYNPNKNMSFNKALDVPTEDQNTIINNWQDDPNRASQLAKDANNNKVNETLDQDNFSIRTALGEHGILPYFDNPVTRGILDAGAGIGTWLGTNWGLNKWGWMAKHPKTRLFADAIAAISAGTLMNAGQDASLNWALGDNRYKLDDKKVIEFLDTLDRKVKNNEHTKEDLAKFYQLTHGGRSLSPAVRKRAKESLELQQSIPTILKSSK